MIPIPLHTVFSKICFYSKYVAEVLRAHSVFKFILLCFIVLLSVGMIPLKAQPDNITTSQSLELEVASLEQAYDSQVIEILSNYFDRRKFFVDVNINADMVNETYTTSQNQILRERVQNVFMPGLPYLPEENLQRGQPISRSPEMVLNQNTIRTLRLNNLTVALFVDSSLTASEVEFMKLLAGIAAKTNEVRGDKITVSQVSMPNLSTEDVGTTASANLQEPTTAFIKLNQYLPEIVILLILLVLAILITRYYYRPKEQINKRKQRDSFRKELNTDDFNHEDSHYSSEKPDRDSSFHELDKLIEKFINKPKEIALLFEYWIDQDPKQGAVRAAEVVNTVDKHLLKSLKNQLNADNYTAIEDKIEQLPLMPLEKKLEVAKTVNTILSPPDKGTNSAQKRNHLALFKFLDHLSNKQIIRLLKGESIQTAALVIDYLPENKAANLLDKIDENEAADVMIKIPSLQNLSYKEHSKISSKLFNKAMDLIEVEKVGRHETEQIRALLAKLPLNEQRKYINQLQASGSPIGEAIHNQFVTIDQIPELSDDIIKDATKSINTETLLEALTGFDEKLVDKILSVRPKREQRLIRMELEQISDDNFQETPEIKQAKYLLMDSIRNTVKQYKRNKAQA